MTPDSPRRGRPPIHSTVPFGTSKMHAMLVAKIADPDVIVDGKVKISELAKRTGLARYTLYRTMNIDSITPKTARKLIAVLDNKLALRDFLPFILPDAGLTD